MNPQETPELMEIIRQDPRHLRMTIILLIEHDMNLVMNICERIYVLNFGKHHRQGHAGGDPEQSRGHRGVSRRREDDDAFRLKTWNVYYGAIHAVKGISFEVNEGEIVTLIGANGAGKSTTLHAISGLVAQDRLHHLLTGHHLARRPTGSSGWVCAGAGGPPRVRAA